MGIFCKEIPENIGFEAFFGVQCLGNLKDFTVPAVNRAFLIVFTGLFFSFIMPTGKFDVSVLEGSWADDF